MNGVITVCDWSSEQTGCSRYVTPQLSKRRKYHRFLKGDALVQAFEVFYALPPIPHQAHYKEPGDGVSFPFHQDSKHRRMAFGDFVDVTGQGSYVQVYYSPSGRWAGLSAKEGGTSLRFQSQNHGARF